MAMRPGETPVNIPNTMVKARTADDTILETVWESRWLPDLKKIKRLNGDEIAGKNSYYLMAVQAARKAGIIPVLILENCILKYIQ